MSRTSILLLALFVVIILLVIWLARGCRTDPPTAAELMAAEEWLYTDCSIGDEGRLEARLIIAGGALEGYFLDAFDNGPPATRADAYADAVTDQFERGRMALVFKPTTPLAAGDSALLSSIDLNTFRTEQRNHYVAAYRSRALLALGLVGGGRARSLLDSVAADSTSSLAVSAQVARAKL